MLDSISHAIAKHLADSNVGLFRTQLFDKIGADAVDGNIDKISLALNAMGEAGHVQKSTRQGGSGSRWSLTPKGRAAYSVLHDNPDESAAALPDTTPPEPPTAAIDTAETTDTHERTQRCAVISFDTDDTMDRALYGLVKLIRDKADKQPVIANKAKKIALLESLENNELLNGVTRYELGMIRQDLAKLEDEL